MIDYASGGKESFKGKRVVISGSGNVAQYAALKAKELGATIVSLSDSQGSLVATDDEGVTPDDIKLVQKLKVERKPLSEIAQTESFARKFKYIDGVRPWTHVGRVDIALPSATQNEVSGDEARALIEAGVKFIAEGSNMGCTQDAVGVFEDHRKAKKGDAIWYGPGKHAPPPPPIVADGIMRSVSRRRETLTRRFFPRDRQGGQRGRCGRVGPRDGAKLPAHLVDGGRGGREAEEHHGGLLPQRRRDGQGVSPARGGRASQSGRGQQHRRLQKSGGGHVRSRGLVVRRGRVGEGDGVRLMHHFQCILYVEALPVHHWVVKHQHHQQRQERQLVVNSFFWFFSLLWNSSRRVDTYISSA